MNTLKRVLKEMMPTIVEAAVVCSTILFLRVTGILNIKAVSGHSMEPNYHSNNLVITSNIPNYDRYDIVTALSPEGVPIIKRIIGLPGDHIKVENEHVYINDSISDESFINNDPALETWEMSGEYTLSENEYFLAGDNRNDSIDSRKYGPVTKNMITGEVIIHIGR